MSRQDSLTDANAAAFMESIELALVGLYDAIIGTALLADSSLAICEVYRTHHRVHAESYALVAGDRARGSANAALAAEIAATLAGIESEGGLLAYAADVESRAAASHGHTLTRVTDAPVVEAASTILPVEAAHAAFLGIVVGRSSDLLLPAPVEPVDGASGFDPAVYPA